MKARMLTFLIALVALLSFGYANAQNPHLMSPLTSTDNGITLTVCYDIAGIGNVSQTKLTITYDAEVISECTNPGGNVAPGQTKRIRKVAEDFIVEVKNGRARGCSTTQNVFEPGRCPNGQWTGAVTDVIFSNISITIAGKTFSVPNP